ncbi:unnamed protein product [Peronospora belbahrii]|uniref:Uncharacterized protein n=1 Tax=Peronospora belbahrii TaxID=622444 RepID=A0ABN8D3C7_9STRA|nr:unnamed protein product [Peronospora belbahrii]
MSPVTCVCPSFRVDTIRLQSIACVKPRDGSNVRLSCHMKVSYVSNVWAMNLESYGSDFGSWCILRSQSPRIPVDAYVSAQKHLLAAVSTVVTNKAPKADLLTA